MSMLHNCQLALLSGFQFCPFAQLRRNQKLPNLRVFELQKEWNPDHLFKDVNSSQSRRSVRLVKKKAFLCHTRLFELRRTPYSLCSLSKDVHSKEANEFTQYYFAMADGSIPGLENILAEDVTLDYFGTVIQIKRLVLEKLTQQNLMSIDGSPTMMKVSADLKYSPVSFNAQLFEHKADRRGSKMNIDTSYEERSVLTNEPVLVSYHGHIRNGFKYVEVHGLIHYKKIREKSSEPESSSDDVKSESSTHDIESESSSDSTGSWSEDCSLLFLYTEKSDCDQLPSTSRQIQSKYKIHVIKYYRY